MASLTNLPPELLDHITSYLPTASAVSSLSRSSRSLQQVVEKNGWANFNRARFPSMQIPHPNKDPSVSYQRDAARTLVTISRNFDRRAFLARYIEPAGNIRSYPGGEKVEKWKRPKGQTIGFTPVLDSYETVGSSWKDREEVLAFSAGAEICVRRKRVLADLEERERDSRRQSTSRYEDMRWVTYRAAGALEGRDDNTSLHLLRPPDGNQASEIQVVRGTANGALQLLDLPLDSDDDRENTSNKECLPRSTFATDGLPVRSTSLLQRQSDSSLLAATLGETRIALYSLDGSTTSEQAPLSWIEVPRPQNGSRSYRAWSTNFISANHLAVGLGPSEDPVHIYPIQSSGIDKESVRTFSLQNDLDRLEGEITLSGFAKKSKSSVYPIAPLSPSSTSDGNGSVFLSGAYDGIVRVHDLRSDRQVEQAYIDPTMDDSAVYSLLPRGQEKLVVGTARHSLLKVFDMRMGAKCYSYLSTKQPPSQTNVGADWNLFLKPHSATYPGRGGGNNWARRSAESSIYSLTSPSACSPHIYAGVENAVLALSFTDPFDPTPDPMPGPTMRFPVSDEVRKRDARDKRMHQRGESEVLNLAMYEQSEKMTLMTQRSIGEVNRLRKGIEHQGWREVGWFVEGLDERWKVGP